MRCPKCGHEQPDGGSECAHCGIVFAKYHRLHADGGDPHRMRPIVSPRGRDPAGLIGKLMLLLLLTYWSVRFITAPIAANAAGESFLHLIDLPFHEFGHILYRPFPPVIVSLGGSLGQLMMPAICFFVLLLKTRDAFGASVCLWWFGENFLDIAPYINDARSLSLPLLGGNTGDTSPYGFHDWNFILTETGMLTYDHRFASIAWGIGTVVMLGALAWAVFLLFRPAGAKES